MYGSMVPINTGPTIHVWVKPHEYYHSNLTFKDQLYSRKYTYTSLKSGILIQIHTIMNTIKIIATNAHWNDNNKLYTSNNFT